MTSDAADLVIEPLDKGDDADLFTVFARIVESGEVFNLVFESNPARPMYEQMGWQQVGRIPDSVDAEAGIVYWRAV